LKVSVSNLTLHIHPTDNVNYINSIEKVEIICPSHGSFYLRPDAHIRKVGCPDCNETKPSYFYIIGNVRKGRFAYRKDQLLEYGFDSNLTEHKICLMNNIFRIHDCGVFKYIWSKLDS
jgi:hypothetical protein